MRLVAAAILLASVLTLASGPAVRIERCSVGGFWGSECEVSNNGEQIDIGASQTNPGDSNGGSSDEGTSDGDSAAPSTPAVEECSEVVGCRGNYSVLAPPEVTIDDLASFRPAAASLTGEPSGFGVVGAPTNVVAAASEQFLTGTLLDWDVTVRFTPAGYLFDYGDGSRARSSTGGASWPALGQAQFTPTSTSHVYRARGTYPVSVSVQYSAAVNFGSGNWRPVAGFVTATSGGYDVQVVSARTALVDKTCLENPSGPGC